MLKSSSAVKTHQDTFYLTILKITMKSKKYWGMLAALSLLSAPVAAEGIEEDFQTWGVFVATGSLGVIHPDLKNFKYWIEGQGRFGDDTSRFSQGMVRNGLGYVLNEKTSIWLGHAWVPTSLPFASRKAFDENRIWQQLLWSDKFSFGTLTSRTRFEQRFFSDLPRSEDTGYRFRQFVKLTLPLPAISPTFGLAFYDELFINLNNTDSGLRSGFALNRGFVGVYQRLNQHTVFEVGYLNQFINTKDNPRADLMQHILAVQLFMNF